VIWSELHFFFLSRFGDNSVTIDGNLIKMFATGQENSCSFSWLNKILSKRNDALFACFLQPSFLHSIFKQENSGKRSGKQSKPSFVFGTDLNDRPQEIEAVSKFSLALSFCTEGKGSGLST